MGKLAEAYTLKSKLGKLMHGAETGAGAEQQLIKKQQREQLIKQYISSPAAQLVWRKAHGMRLCQYHKIFDILKADFSEYTFSKRKLEQNNLMQCFRISGMNQDLTIPIEKFDAMYSWFHGLTRLVQTLSDYYNKSNPVVIHGFVSRDDAQRMLLNEKCQIGTFIIRFRYKEPKSIAISYKKKMNFIANIKCDLSPNNDSTFICGKKSMPLPQFIATFQPLEYLYVHKQSPIAKEIIFHQPKNNNNNNQNANVPSWNGSNSWNPPTNNNNKQQQQHPYNAHQPKMIHAPTANPYNANHQPGYHRNYSPQPGMNGGYTFQNGNRNRQM